MSQKPASYPPGAFNAHWFGLCNAIAWQVMMGGPIILFAKSLGASATVLGIIAAFTPLMTVMQIPATKFMERTSYRRFMLCGWGTRTLFIFATAAIPLLGFLDQTTRIALLLASLFLFNLLRGISSAGWMPWITAIIPDEIRGTFLARDQIFAQAGSLITLLLAAFMLRGDVAPIQFTLVFLFSATGATASLYFINRIPDVPSAEAVQKSSAPVPWKAILRHPPFFRLLAFNVVVMLFIGGLGAFTVSIQREVFGFGPDRILFLAAATFVIPLATFPFLGPFFERVRPKALLAAGIGGILLTVVIWLLMACGAMPRSLWGVVACNTIGGVCGATFNVSNSRIAMATMPLMGRNHFFALFTVITSLALGVAPVAWGLLIDAAGAVNFRWGGITVERYGIYFAAAIGVGIASLAAIRGIVEPGGVAGVERSPLFALLQRKARDWQR